MAEPDPMRAEARRALFEMYRDRGDSVWISATGTSMLPWIRPTSWLLVDFGVRGVGVGEIAVVPRGNVLVGHRVVRTDERSGRVELVTKGDASLDFDPPVSASEVLGVVRGLRRTRDGITRTRSCRGPLAVAMARLSAVVGRLASAVRLAHHILRVVRARRGRRRSVR